MVWSWLSVVPALIAVTIVNADIKVDCFKESVSITWRIPSELVEFSLRLFLGNCFPSHWSVLPSGEGEATFNYKFSDCKFKSQIKGKSLIYQNELTYRPFPKPEPAAYSYPIECVYDRPEGWSPSFLNPASGSTQGEGELVFHMALLNADLSSLAKTNVIPLGSFIPIWAVVEQKSHQPLLLLMEECVAAVTPELHSDTQVYPIITNYGCLVDGKSRFLPRYHTSAILLYLQSSTFVLEQEVYIHCKLVAWDPEALSEKKKICHRVKEGGGWTLLDDPNQSSLCSCCDSSCESRHKRDISSDPQGLVLTSVLGPLTIVDSDEPSG